jgi:hypothetical protein
VGPAAATGHLERLTAALGEPVAVQAAAAPALRLELRCPAGRVVLPIPGRG